MSYKDDLDRYAVELGALVQERVEIDRKIHRLKQVIEGLSAMSGIDSDEALAPLTEYENRGLTTGVRQALKFSGQYKTASEVRQMLIAAGYTLSGYANASAAINTILRRLVKQQQVEVEPGSQPPRFRWAVTRNALRKLKREPKKSPFYG